MVRHHNARTVRTLLYRPLPWSYASYAAIAAMHVLLWHMHAVSNLSSSEQPVQQHSSAQSALALHALTAVVLTPCVCHAGTLQFVLDIELLTHADYFVGTTNSGLPHVVDVLRFAVYNKDRATFVDASFRHQDWYSRMRRFWHAKAEGAARRVLSIGQMRPDLGKSHRPQHRNPGRQRI